MPTKYDAILMFDIELDGGTQYVATQDYYSGGVKYRGCVLPESFSISRQMPQLFYGIAPTAEFSFSMDGTDDGVNSTWLEIFTSDEFRGRWTKVQSYDETNGIQFVAYGRLNGISFGERVEISTSAKENVFDTVLPRHTVTTDDFDPTAIDLGKPVNICFGHCRNVPLYNVLNDRINNYYDYIIGYGVIEAIDHDEDVNLGVKRDGVLVDPSEYTFYDGSGAPHAGYACIRFIKEQMNFSGGYYSLTADVKGLELGGASADRNFISVIYNLLTDSTWGLGDSADAASFAAAAAIISNANGLYCDGAIINQENAGSVLDDLLMPSRAYLERASDGEWEITVAQTSASVGTFGLNDGIYNNIVSCGPIVPISADQMISTVKVHYDLGLERAFDLPGDNDPAHFAEISHTIDADLGIEQVYELRFVRETLTAKKFISFIDGNMTYSNHVMDLAFDLSGRDIRINQVVTLDIPIRNLSSADYIVQSHRYDAIRKHEVTVRPYNALIYGDVVLSTPVESTPTPVVVVGPRSIISDVNLGDGVTWPGRLTLQVAPTYGDTYVAAGKTDFTNAESGFIFGIDDSDADRVKAYIGDPTNYFNWTGTGLIINTSGLVLNTDTGVFTWAGDLALGAIPGFPRANRCFLDVEFTEGYGTIVHDSSAQHATGTCYNAPSWTGSGPLGKAIGFASASSQYVDFGTNANWDVLGSGTRDMSWSFWIYVTGPAVTTNDVFFGKGAYNVGGWRFFFTTDGKVSLEINKSGGATYVTTADALPYSAWNKVDFVYRWAAADAGTVDIYINGVFEKTVSNVATMASGAAYNLLFGATNGPASYFDGYLQAVKLYNSYALTAANVKALYKFPQGARGGQLTARSVMVGTPSGSAPGTRIDDTGIWAYGAAGAQLFGFCTIASGTVTWNAQALSAGYFVMGDFNANKGMKFDGNFAIRLAASSTLTVSGGAISVTSGSISISSTGALNISAGTHTWSGGTFNITGAAINISSTGSFACSGASFSITAGTASISTTSGLTIAAGSKIAVDSTNGIYFGTSTQLYASSTSTKIEPQSSGKSFTYASYGVPFNIFTVISTNQYYHGSFYVCNVSDATVRFSVLSTGIAGTVGYLNIEPYAGDTYSLGASTGAGTRWLSANINTINYCTPNDYCASFYDDGDKCVSILQGLRGLKDKDGVSIIGRDGNYVLDKRTLPDELTNKETLFEEIKKEIGKDYGYTQFIEEWDSGKFERSRSGRNTDHLLDVVVGSIVYKLLPQINSLKTEIETLKKRG